MNNNYGTNITSASGHAAELCLLNLFHKPPKEHTMKSKPARGNEIVGGTNRCSWLTVLFPRVILSIDIGPYDARPNHRSASVLLRCVNFNDMDTLKVSKKSLITYKSHRATFSCPLITSSYSCSLYLNAFSLSGSLYSCVMNKVRGTNRC